MINVTKTFLPPQEEYQAILNRAWNNKWLTNRGELVKELENKLKGFLNVSYLNLTTNGTLPLQIAIKALKLKGEIITTPFSYVATISSIVWEGCTPVFVDIDSEHLTIDETKIAAAITEKTTAILATHVFGNPCNVEAIDEIAKKHGLKIIYDAAHCFGVQYKHESLFNYGDVSTCSFHATKIFHTGEGGCWITGNEKLHKRLFFHHNFGHKGREDFHGIGINAKMSELQAAMGLAVFKNMDDIFEGRQKVVQTYLDLLKTRDKQFLKIREFTKWNFHYFPLIFNNEEKLQEVKGKLNANNIFPRRYFYPSLNTLNYVRYKPMPVSESIAKRILCLPNYYDLKLADVEKISRIINETV